MLRRLTMLSSAIRIPPVRAGTWRTALISGAAALTSFALGCGSSSQSPGNGPATTPGQSDFVSVTPGGSAIPPGSPSGGALDAAGTATVKGGTSAGVLAGSVDQRQVEETDL